MWQIRWTRFDVVAQRRSADAPRRGVASPVAAAARAQRKSALNKTRIDLFSVTSVELDESMPTSASRRLADLVFQFAGVRSAPPAPRLMFTFVDQSALQAAVRGQGCSAYTHSIRGRAGGERCI
jgi:hypothetical protein